MASRHSADRLTARDEYLDALDRRFPDHPYKEQAGEWRDLLLLEEVEGRAKTLSSPVKIPPPCPRTTYEGKYVVYDGLAAKAAAEGDESQAAIYWREMSKAFNPEDPDQRKWYLLAVEACRGARDQDPRSPGLRDRATRAKARAAFDAGRPTEALTIQATLKEKYGQFRDLDGPARAARPGPARSIAPGPASLRSKSRRSPSPAPAAVRLPKPRAPSTPSAKLPVR